MVEEVFHLLFQSAYVGGAEKSSWEGDVKDSLVGMQFTHSRAIRNVETPGSEGSIRVWEANTTHSFREPKKMTCASQSLQTGSPCRDGRNQKMKKLNEELAWEQLCAW